LHGDLLKLVLQLQKQLAEQAKVIARQAKPIKELESEHKELRKKNPMQRLNDAYSVMRALMDAFRWSPACPGGVSLAMRSSLRLPGST
jgi:hypothetical protein